MEESMSRARCPSCRKVTKLPDADIRKFYRTAQTIHHLDSRPEWIAWVIDAKGSRAQRAIFRKWAGTCRDCQNGFIETRSSLLLDNLAALLQTLRHKIRSLESELSSLRLHVGAVEGVREHVVRIRDNANERSGRGLVDSGYVYAIGTGRHVKIGWAKDLDKRLAALQTSSPKRMQLLGSIVGFRCDERRVQQRFARYHVRGEWYRDAAAIRDFFAALPAGGRDPA
jgi:hypothetical protein